MSTIGLFALLIAFAATALGVIALLVGHILRGKELGDTLSWAGRVAAIVAFIGLTVACGVLLYCFIAGDYSIQYVLNEHSKGSNLFFAISGLWAGRQGSLLFWAWLMGLFTMLVSVRRMSQVEPLDNIASMVCQLVLVAFVGVLLFSEDNMPFIVTAAKYFAEDGTLNASASVLGMNTLLEHWAMAIHPPTLFVGYAGLLVPFAYAIAACVVNDASKAWVLRAERFALLAWFALTIGIGLGAVWAYTVLGWGGFWGWDPVENASLLPWLVSVALIHSFMQYKRRGVCKKWAILSAGLAFFFCIVGTFITRSGLVQSVHAFEGDPVSLVLFGALMAVSLIAIIVCCLVRSKSFADEVDDFESMVSRDGAFWINNLVMIVLAVLLTYLTIAQALPTFLPLGGRSVGTGTYESIARPIGILYLLLLAVCPLLSWGKTDPKAFMKRAKVPAICAIVAFIVAVAYCVTTLFPRYFATLAAGGSNATVLLSYGPSVYYCGLTIVGFLVASLLLFNSLFQLARAASAKSAGIRAKLGGIGSSLSHAGMGVLLAGLLGSMMFVTQTTGYMAADLESNTASETFTILDYELTFENFAEAKAENGIDEEYTVTFSVTKDGAAVGTVSPSLTWVANTQQQRLNAGVMGFPTEDLFVIFRGTNEAGALSMDVRVNPLINFVWAGFYMLIGGMLVSLFGRRGGKAKAGEAAALAAAPAAGETATADEAPTEDTCETDASETEGEQA